MNWVPPFAGTTYNKTLTTIRRFENLFQTDYGYTDSRIKFAGDGPNYIQKPFTVEGLARKVKDVLKKMQMDQHFYKNLTFNTNHKEEWQSS